MKIKKVTKFEELKIDEMLLESLGEGYNFIEKLINEYKSGENIFSQENECLFVIKDDVDMIVAVGGIQEDIYEKNPDIGRVKHVYVLKEYRKQKIGTLLLQHLIAFSKDHYKEVHLRTPKNNKSAGLFYESIGFKKCEGEINYSHQLSF